MVRTWHLLGMNLQSLHRYWDVFTLFLIPVGGGIPAGVILARDRAVAWPKMMLLYLVSDIVLACVFEPLMMIVRHYGKRSLRFTKFSTAFKASMDKTIARFGVNPGPFTLILISFGVDPMTGRAAALAAGHNFFTGWSIAIAGDMIYFVILMVSSLWLNDLLGDGTWTVIIVTGLMFLVPYLIRRFRESRQTDSSQTGS